VTNWETIEAPSGSFIGWGAKKGQHVTGRVVEYAIDGGTDFNGGKCPLISIELTEKAASFNKEGDRTDHEAGTIVNITAGQVKLKSVLRKADPAPGDLVKVELTGVAKTANGNTLKEFTVQIARGAGGAPAKPKAAEADSFDGGDDTPPF
jgi:hypothetical protein